MSNWFTKLFKKEKQEKTISQKYSYCETETAGPLSKWHIRELSEKGKRLGGGADTPSLCGKKVAWDLRPEVTFNTFDGVCSKCLEKFENLKLISKEKQ